MNKWLVAILVILGVTSCTKKDKYYYESHPYKLQQAISYCRDKQSDSVTCNQLRALANQMNHLAYQLQGNPQQFGAKILALQERIIRQQEQLKKGSNDESLQADINQNKRDLKIHLAVVKWLESPAS
jgi:hypothetical protein